VADLAPKTTPAEDARGSGTIGSAETPTVAPGALTALLQELAATPSVSWEEGARWDVLAPGDVIADRFELAREISRGGFGVVLEAWDRQLTRHVAFKVLRPARRSRTELGDASLREEAEVAARLHHPNIVTVFDVGSCMAGPYVILELLQGETLAARLQRGVLSAREAVRVAVEMARGLEHAHRAGVVHRDLKPSNVFLCEDGSVKLLDFGVALVMGSDRSGAAGTPAYMAPEVLRGARGDERSDVFGLGAVLFEMLTGRLPYERRHGKSSALEPGPEPSLDAPGVRALVADLVR
jgi:serine/threonine protein kinase